MTQYQPLSRKYRPQNFSQVLGQQAIITTLKNAIKFNRVSHAYLFCGSRGCGKTTVARIFAKAINCKNLSDEQEPCNQCDSCKEIIQGNSLDILEIDGASNRGIDDIRKINETAGYSTATGGNKIYIIDEVHMLTKEAFNALLKTLEEPPPKTKFFFATTEPHKVLPTILSRCQRFNFQRIPVETIVQKLQYITDELNVSIAPGALRMIAKLSDGAMRDAESLLDQVLSFNKGNISEQIVAETLGVVSQEIFFKLDEAGKQGNLNIAFEISEEIYSKGKHISHFIDSLLFHFRTHLAIHLTGKEDSLSQELLQKYQKNASLYTKEQLLSILDDLVQTQNNFRFCVSEKVTLEALLLRILRSFHQIPIETLVAKLSELESKIATKNTTISPEPKVSQKTSPPPSTLASSQSFQQPDLLEKKQKPKVNLTTPKTQVEKKIEPKKEKQEKNTTQSTPKKSRVQKETLMQFAAVELDGTLEIKNRN